MTTLKQFLLTHPPTHSLNPYPWHDSGGHPKHHRAPRGHHAVRCSVGRCWRPRRDERHGGRGRCRHGHLGRAGLQDGCESGPVPLVRQRRENSLDVVTLPVPPFTAVCSVATCSNRYAWNVLRKPSGHCDVHICVLLYRIGGRTSLANGNRVGRSGEINPNQGSTLC